MAVEIQPPRLAQLWLARAEEKRRAIQFDIDHADFRTALFDAYFAMFRAEKALLASVGGRSRTHQGTIHLFAEHFVRAGKFERRWLGVLARGKEAMHRHDNDITFRPTREQALQAQAEANEFVRLAGVVLADMQA